MTQRFALIVGIDRYDHHTDLRGARHDADDLAEVLNTQGTTVRVLHDADAATLMAGVQWLADQLHDSDHTALLHVSARGTNRRPDGLGIAARDARGDHGVVPLADLLSPLADHPVRSVLVRLDVGFGVGDATTRTLGTSSLLPPAHPMSGDPVVFANGPLGPVDEVERDGVMRGAHSYALARTLEQIGQDGGVTLGELMDRLAAHRIADVVPVFGPADRAGAWLGAFVDGQRGHLPWRGVDADYQIEFGYGPITPRTGPGAWGQFTVQGNTEQWSWSAAPWPPAGFKITIQGLGGGQLGQAPPAINFNNDGFAAGSKPTLAGGDRLWTVTGFDGRNVIVLLRANVAAIEWHTDQDVPGDKLQITVGQVLTFSPLAAVPDWNAWFSAIEARQP